jgi:exodeoxyribonuclease VII small subunit
MPKKTAPPTSESNQDAPTFESAYQELQEIVAQLERGDLPLEHALELHARGQQLATLCMTQLDQAELKVKKLEVSHEG